MTTANPCPVPCPQDVNAQPARVRRPGVRALLDWYLRRAGPVLAPMGRNAMTK